MGWYDNFLISIHFSLTTKVRIFSSIFFLFVVFFLLKKIFSLFSNRIIFLQLLNFLNSSFCPLWTTWEVIHEMNILSVSLPLCVTLKNFLKEGLTNISLNSFVSIVILHRLLHGYMPAHISLFTLDILSWPSTKVTPIYLELLW